MKETLTDRMLHAAAHCEGMYDLLDEAKALRDGVAEIEQLRLAEEGANEAFCHVVQQKRDLEAECTRLRGLLDGAYDTIRRQLHNSNSTTP